MCVKRNHNGDVSYCYHKIREVLAEKLILALIKAVKDPKDNNYEITSELYQWYNSVFKPFSIGVFLLKSCKYRCESEDHDYKEL